MTTPVLAGAVLGPRWEWGDRLRKVRRSVAKMSQPDMAAVIGVRATTYAAWEAGRTEPPLRVAKAVAARLETSYPGQVSAAWMLGVGGENADAESEVLLPRMDSNHQPCDWGNHAGQLPLPLLLASHRDLPLPVEHVAKATCVMPITFLPIGCDSDVGINRYQSKQVYDKHHISDVSPVSIRLQSWGGYQP